jgi:hypothetical protein
MEENENREEIIISLAEKLVSRKRLKILFVAIVFISLAGLIFIIPPLCFKFVPEGDVIVLLFCHYNSGFFLVCWNYIYFYNEKILTKNKTRRSYCFS